MRRTGFLFSLIALAALMFAMALPRPVEAVGGDTAAAAFVPNQVIVRYSDDASDADIARVMARVGASQLERIASSPAAGRVDLLGLPAGIAVAQAVRQLSLDPAVVYAEPNFIYTRQATFPNDPQFDQLWGLHNTGQPIAGGEGGTPDADMDAPEAWDRDTGSATVWVGVIDEGIDFRHEDLGGVVINPGEDANGDGVITAADFNGIDDDGNGFVDDVHGWDFVNDDNSIFDGRNANDGADAHGTHVSGTIGAIGNNGKGVVGVNWNVRIINAKFLGRAGGTTADAIKSVDYMTDFKVNRGVNLITTNNSWGGGGFSQALQDAIERANAAGVLFCAAAGNAGNDNDETPFFPASYPNANVIAVAALNRFDELAGFSNFGATSVDVGAPGVTVLSTTPFNTYRYFSGTSMATPHVAGLCALLKSNSPRLSAARIKDRILATVVRIPVLAGKCVSEGRINAYRALNNTTRSDP